MLNDADKQWTAILRLGFHAEGKVTEKSGASCLSEWFWLILFIPLRLALQSFRYVVFLRTFVLLVFVRGVWVYPRTFWCITSTSSRYVRECYCRLFSLIRHISMHFKKGRVWSRLGIQVQETVPRVIDTCTFWSFERAFGMPKELFVTFSQAANFLLRCAFSLSLELHVLECFSLAKGRHAAQCTVRSLYTTWRDNCIPSWCSIWRFGLCCDAMCVFSEKTKLDGNRGRFWPLWSTFILCDSYIVT